VPLRTSLAHCYHLYWPLSYTLVKKKVLDRTKKGYIAWFIYETPKGSIRKHFVGFFDPNPRSSSSLKQNWFHIEPLGSI
jgi:hypothetical protein